MIVARRILVALVAAAALALGGATAAHADPSWMDAYLCNLTVPQLVELEAQYRANPDRIDEAERVRAEIATRTGGC